MSYGACILENRASLGAVTRKTSFWATNHCCPPESPSYTAY